MTFQIPEDARALLMKRQILLVGDITGSKQEAITASIIYLNALGEEPITLFIDSYGGSTSSGILTCDAVEQSVAPVHGYVTGYAHSNAFFVLQCCERRIAYPHAQLMFHATRVEWRIDDPRLEEYIKKTTALYQERLEMISARSGHSVTELKAWGKEERTYTAQEGIELGFLDEIAKSKRRWRWKK